MSDDFPEWVDGRAFAGWLEGRRPDLYQVISESQQRTLYRLRSENGCGSLDVVDRFCVVMSLHINEIPEWIWTTKRQRKPKRKNHPKETRDKAVRMVNSGTAIRDVSEMLGIPTSTIKEWKRASKQTG